MLHFDLVVKKADRTAQSFATECLAGLRRAEALRKGIIERTARTIDETLTGYNELLTAASASNALAGLMSEVHPDEAIRDAARECEQEVSRFYSDLALDRDMYEAVAAVDVSGSDPDTQRFHAHTLRDYRRAGVDKSPADRARLKQIDEELTKLGQQFSKNISEDVRSITIDAADAATRLAGLPVDFIAAHPANARGKIKITTDYPDYNPFMTYADDDELRKELYVLFRSRGDQQNESVLRDILKLRAEKATLLGFQNWADYVTADKMIGSGTRAAEFIEKVWKLAAPRAEQDYKELLGQLQKNQPRAKHVTDWQKVWLENRVKRDKYEVDSSEVRQYFPYDRVLAGLLEITSEIFDLAYIAVPDQKDPKDLLRWHPSVLVYDVVRGRAKLGRIYLDMHPREGKYKHAAQFPLKDGVRGVQLPEGVLVCNFSAPSEGGVALMEHDDVVTMFHEFGHLMHHVLGGHQKWITQSGVATEWDFVEAPSQMFEEWAWSYETLARFARHHETGEAIPADLVDKMRRADKFGLGTATVQQIFYAAISLGFHRADPDKLDQLSEIQRLQKRYTPFAYVPGTRFHTSFGHLVGYSAMYYTYQWSLVIAKDLLTPFQHDGLMAKAVTFAYRDKVLAPGGSRDAAELVRDFLGRDYDFAAYERFLVAHA
ncbi:MAG: Zn-dependent oligopeptidase [Deltaproteobacteria bacterium]|nr:Zn-dependent oligopeptidase [Deltaproteobacteria bacterium]